jgi:hypothetical protein
VGCAAYRQLIGDGYQSNRDCSCTDRNTYRDGELENSVESLSLLQPPSQGWLTI